LGHRASECWSKGGKGGKGGKAGAPSSGKGHGTPFQGFCGFCKGWGHKAADCRKKQSERDKKAAAVQEETLTLLTNQKGEHAVAARGVEAICESCTEEWDIVSDETEYHDIYVGTEFEPNEETWGYIMAINSDAPWETIKEYELPILLDSGSDEHMCPRSWHTEADLVVNPRAGILRDVQGRAIREEGQRWVTMAFQGDTGLSGAAGSASESDEVRASSCFTVGGVSGPLLSAGKIVKSGGEIHLTPAGSWMTIGGRDIAVRMQGSRFVVDPVRTVSAVTYGAVAAGERMTEEEAEAAAFDIAEGMHGEAAPATPPAPGQVRFAHAD